jgi:mannosyltransferase OCH1-like enzyme
VSQDVIPKIIHQTSGSKPLPPLIVDSIAALRERNPNWEYRFYSDADIEEYIDCHFPQHSDIYRRINPRYGAARADLFRYLLLFREGGVYLDIKSTIHRALEEVIRHDDQFLLSHWNNGPGTEHELWGTYPEIANPRGEFLQCFLVSRPGHPFLASVIEQVVANLQHYDLERDGVGLRVRHLTGPVVFTLAITPLLGQFPSRLVCGEQDLGFEYNLYQRASDSKHRHLFEHHYSGLDEPIVLPPLPGPDRT